MDMEKLQKKIIGVPQMHSALIVREKVDNENRTVPVLFSTETPILHWFGYLILSHDAGCMVMDRLNNGAPLLKDHDVRQQIGKIENAEVDTKEKCGRADVRFSKNNPVADIEFKDMMDGIRTKCSVGFVIRTLVPETGKDKKQIMIDSIPVFRALLWEPHEISTVSLEGDTNTGLNRALDLENIDDEVVAKIAQRMLEINNTNHNSKGETTMVPETTAPAALNETEIRAKETNRINAIDATVKFMAQHVPNIHEIRSKAVNEGWTPEKFSNEVLPLIATRSVDIKPGQTGMETLGLTMKDVRGFSVTRAIRQLATAKQLSGVEKAVSDHIVKFEQRQSKDMTVSVPVELLMRDLSAGTATKGAELVGTDVLTAEFIELQRNKTVVEKAGARLLTGLVGNVAIPRATGGATAYWLEEGASGTLSDQAFGQVAMSPRRLLGATAFTKQLLFQTAFGVEAFVMQDIQTVLKIAKDLAALNGSGADGQPLGILNMTGLSTSVTFGAAATFAKMIEFETNVATQNADEGALSYITTPGVRGKLKAKAKDTNGSGFVWEKGMVNDYPAFATNQMPSNLVLFGNFNDLVIGEWAGVDITVDPYTLALDGKIRIIIEMHCDIVARHAASFCKSADSGAQ